MSTTQVNHSRYVQALWAPPTGELEQLHPHWEKLSWRLDVCRRPHCLGCASFNRNGKEKQEKDTTQIAVSC